MINLEKLNGEDLFWLTIWKYIAMVIICFMVLGFSSCQMTRYRIGQAIEGGVDPMLAACALNSGNTDSNACIANRLIAEKEK